MLATLQAAVTSHADLWDADLQNANLQNAYLWNANLSHADLSHADLSYANLQNADLQNANLSHANLSRANLSRANLSRANLSQAKWDGVEILNIIQLSGIGSERRATVAIILADAVQIQCGCFAGTLEEFAAKIETHHVNNPRYLAEYRAAVEWITTCAEACREPSERKEKEAT
jgi:uncharacterized protein YjbI with pentapeptide repeats